MYQLSSEEPFSDWGELSNLRQDFIGRNSAAVYGVAVPGNAAGYRDHIWHLLVWLMPKLGGDSQDVLAKTLYFTLTDNDAKSAAKETIHGLKATLKELTERRFPTWFLRSGWKQSRLGKWLVMLASTASLMLLLLLVVLPDEFLRDDAEIAPWMLAFIAATGVPLAVLFGAFVRHRMTMTKDSKAWLDLLKGSRMLMAASNDMHLNSPNFNLPVKGASYSVTLALSLLLALDNSRPARSTFFRQIIAQLRLRAAIWLFTGWLHPDGSIGAVEYLDEKFNAAVDHGGIAAVVHSKEECPSHQHANQATLVGRAVVPNATAHARTSPRRPQVLRYDTLSDLLFEAGQPPRYAASRLLLLVSVCLAGLAIWAAFDGRWMFCPPAMSKVSMTFTGSGDQADASVTIFSAAPNQFAAKVKSEYWQSLPAMKFPKSEAADRGATIGFKLTKSPTARGEFGIYEGTIEIIRLRPLLWRSLPPVEKVSIATINKLVNTGPTRSSK